MASTRLRLDSCSGAASADRPLRRDRLSCSRLVCLALAVPLAACGGSKAGRSEAPPSGAVCAAEDTCSRSHTVAPAVACGATRRALLGQGYIVRAATAETLARSKRFWPESNIHTQLHVHASCVPQRDAGAIVFINAVQERDALKEQSRSVSVGVSMIGSTSVPVLIGGDNANLVRVDSNTVQHQQFCTRLFDRMSFYLPGTPAMQPPPPVEPETPPDPVLP